MKFTAAILSLTIFSANFVSPIAAGLRSGGGQGEAKESSLQSTCSDSPSEWHDSDGAEFDCAWYADTSEENRCSIYGSDFENMGNTANQACCACGGGVETPNGPPPTPAPAPVPENPTGGGEAPFKIKMDNFGVAQKFKEVLDKYIPVELVTGNDFHVDLSGISHGTGNQMTAAGSAFCSGGITYTVQIDTNNQASYENTFVSLLRWVLEDLGIQQQGMCDAGYMYAPVVGTPLQEVSCCTAQQLTTINQQCFKGRQDPNPTCWSPPDVTPAPNTPIVKVKVLVSRDLLSQGWTEDDTRNELEQANRLLASSSINDIRFVLHGQQTAPSGLFGTESGSNLIAASNFGAADSDSHNYNVIMYLNKINPFGGINTGSAGWADPFLCGSNPSAVVANMHSRATAVHELMHTLGADHDSICNDEYIKGIDLGMSTCNINVMKSKIPTYTCLARASSSSHEGRGIW